MKSFILFTMLMVIGCAEKVPEKVIANRVYVTPPDSLLQTIKVPSFENYSEFKKKECAVQNYILEQYSFDLLIKLGKANSKIKSIRRWKEKHKG